MVLHVGFSCSVGRSLELRLSVCALRIDQAQELPAKYMAGE
jgi:hypothetical protein